MNAEREVVFEFELRHKHALIASPEEWAEWIASLNVGLPAGIDEESLKVVYEYFDNGDWRSEEELHELGVSRSTWYDVSDARVDDLRVDVVERDADGQRK